MVFRVFQDNLAILVLELRVSQAILALVLRVSQVILEFPDLVEFQVIQELLVLLDSQAILDR